MSDSGETLVDHTDFTEYPDAPYNGWAGTGVGWMLKVNPGAGDAFLEFKGDTQGPMLAGMLKKTFTGLQPGCSYRLAVRTKAIKDGVHPTKLLMRRGGKVFMEGVPITNEQWHVQQGRFTATSEQDELQLGLGIGSSSEDGSWNSKDYYYPAFYSIDLYLESVKG